MGRKVALAATVGLIAALSAGLVGGQVGGSFWWGDREPIYIYGNEGFHVGNGVTSGCGTAGDPYVIQGWRVDAPSADYGIYVDHTTSHFVIRDCVIERARTAGIYFNSARNGRVEGCQISRSDTAIYLLNADENVLKGNVVAECKYGVVLAADSRDNRIIGNSFIDNGLNGHDPQRRNCWFGEGGGNYWSNYVGVDQDDNGIGDEPYYPLRDAYPLMVPPVEWSGRTPSSSACAGCWISPQGALVVTSDTPIALSSVDAGSGPARIRFAIDGGEWSDYDGPIFLTGDDGPRRITYFGIDNLGNAEPQRTTSLVLDNHPPLTRLEVGDPRFEDERGTWITSATRISLPLIQGSTYGVTRTFFRINGGNWQHYSGPFVLLRSDGPHQVGFYSQNASGVTESERTAMLYVDNAPPDTRGARASLSTQSEVDEPRATGEAIGVEQPSRAPSETGIVEELDEIQTPPEVTEAREEAQTPSETGIPRLVEEIQTSSEVTEDEGAIQTPSETLEGTVVDES
jgi:parallel beta-helix repeat protein